MQFRIPGLTPSPLHASFGEQVAETPSSPEVVREGEQRARELQLYAARLEVVNDPHF
jgi:hypothetical protein